MSLMSLNICFGGGGARFQQYFNTKILFLVIFLHIHMLGGIGLHKMPPNIFMIMVIERYLPGLN